MNHVIDTNVLIVASAHAVLPEPRDATPAEPELREEVFKWLSQLDGTDAAIVLDYQWKIRGEYENKLGEQDYGIQVIQAKFDRDQVIMVSVEYDADGYGILPGSLASCRWDNSDKKFGCAAFEAREAAEPVEIVNASDTDWYDVQAVLASEQIGLRQLTDCWCRARYRAKKGHEPPIA